MQLENKPLALQCGNPRFKALLWSSLLLPSGEGLMKMRNASVFHSGFEPDTRDFLIILATLSRAPADFISHAQSRALASHRATAALPKPVPHPLAFTQHRRALETSPQHQLPHLPIAACAREELCTAWRMLLPRASLNLIK